MIVESKYATRSARDQRERTSSAEFMSELYKISAARNRLPIERAFWGRVHQPAEGCWEWQGPRNRLGEGVFTYRGQSYLVQGVARRLARQSLGGGVDTDCGNGLCCRPDHLVTFVQDSPFSGETE